MKKTRVSQAFPEISHAMTFLFDNGDSLHFNVNLKQTGTKLAKVRYPRQVTTRGEAPAQYPDSDDIDDDDLPAARTDP